MFSTVKVHQKVRRIKTKYSKLATIGQHFAFSVGKKWQQLEKSTPPPVVVMTNMSYGIVKYKQLLNVMKGLKKEKGLLHCS